MEHRIILEIIIICIFIGLFMVYFCYPIHHFEINESRDKNFEHV